MGEARAVEAPAEADGGAGGAKNDSDRPASGGQRIENLDRAVHFYEELLGARLIARFDPPGFAFFDLGGVRLLLEGGAPPAMLYLTVPDVEAAAAELSARGVVFEGEPHVIFTDDSGLFGPPGGEEWMAFFRDSEGNLVELSSRRAP